MLQKELTNQVIYYEFQIMFQLYFLFFNYKIFILFFNNLLDTLKRKSKSKNKNSTKKICLSKSTERAFVERNEEMKMHYLLEKLNVSSEIAENIAKGQTLLEVSHLNDLSSENLSDLFANENVEFWKILPSFCDSDCFKYLCGLIIEKKGIGKVCKICESKECPETNKQVKWISCASCLYSFHYVCVNIKRKPRSKHWYCIDC